MHSLYTNSDRAGRPLEVGPLDPWCKYYQSKWHGQIRLQQITYTYILRPSNGSQGRATLACTCFRPGSHAGPTRLLTMLTCTSPRSFRSVSLHARPLAISLQLHTHYHGTHQLLTYAQMFDDMALAAGKENVAPATSSDPLQRKGLSPRKSSKGRSKSIGPGGLEEDGAQKQEQKDEMKNRRKSAFVPAVKGILPGQADAERKAARRKSMANRRVSFAPEATLHTWDVQLLSWIRAPFYATRAVKLSRTVTRTPTRSTPEETSTKFRRSSHELQQPG
jgi:hypothetical protein